MCGRRRIKLNKFPNWNEVDKRQDKYQEINLEFIEKPVYSFRGISKYFTPRCHLKPRQVKNKIKNKIKQVHLVLNVKQGVSG